MLVITRNQGIGAERTFGGIRVERPRRVMKLIVKVLSSYQCLRSQKKEINVIDRFKTSGGSVVFAIGSLLS